MKVHAFNYLALVGAEFKISQAAGELLDVLPAIVGTYDVGDAPLAVAALLAVATEAQREIQGGPTLSLTVNQKLAPEAKVNVLSFRTLLIMDSIGHASPVPSLMMMLQSATLATPALQGGTPSLPTRHADLTYASLLMASFSTVL